MARDFFRIFIMTSVLISLGCDRDSNKNKSPSSSVNQLSTGEQLQGSCHLSLSPDKSPMISPENLLEEWEKPRTQEFCTKQWNDLIAANPVRQKIVHRKVSTGFVDEIFDEISEQTVDVSNDERLRTDGGVDRFDISKSYFISSCTSQGLSGIEDNLGHTDVFSYFSRKVQYLGSWVKLYDLYKQTPPPKLVKNQIESVTVPAGTFSSRYFKFQKEETKKGIPVNRVYQMWLSGIGINERTIKISEHVEHLDGKLISGGGFGDAGHSELVYCGWQQASDLWKRGCWRDCSLKLFVSTRPLLIILDLAVAVVIAF